MLKLASLIENPGEPQVTSRYNDPAQLKDLGYNGLVLFGTTALSGVSRIDEIADREMRRWVEKAAEHVRSRITAASEAGLETYLFYDVLALPTDIVLRNREAYCCSAGGPPTLCPASEPAMRRSMEALDALLTDLPEAAGIALRFGETDAHRLPHLVGNDLYSPHCPRCSQLGRADRVVNVIARAYDSVVAKHGKRLIARAWNVRPGGFHDNTELAERIAERLPGDPTDDRLVLSFKLTKTDFWRYQQWNPSSLACGGRPVLYELQCQREYEGKGAVPNWQPPLWSHGPIAEELAMNGVADNPPDGVGLGAAAQRINLAGVMAWVRGGGWGGPFIKDESWVDANAWAVPILADDPATPLADLAKRWATDRLGLSDHSAGKVAQVLMHSAEAARQAFYMRPYSATKGSAWHPAADWLSDDLLDADACWRMIQRIPVDRLTEAVAEKEHAAATIARDRQALQQLTPEPGERHGSIQHLTNSLAYTQSLYETLRDLVAGLAAYRKWQFEPSDELAATIRRKLADAQTHFNHHTQRHALLPGTATPYREKGFWDLTQRVMDEVG